MVVARVVVVVVVVLAVVVVRGRCEVEVASGMCFEEKLVTSCM